MYLGAHIGIAAGLAEVPAQARRIGGQALQIFSKSPQMWNGPAIPDDAAAAFRANVRAEGIRATAVHHGYLANLASPKTAMLARSRAAFVEEIRRAEKLGVDGLIFHPGAHLDSGASEGVRVLVESLTRAFAEVAEGRVRVLLENAAGQGTAMGTTFAELAEVIDRVGARDRTGVALDTCHLFASGVDFRTPSTYGATMDRLEANLGRASVYAFHLNDAKLPLGSRRDRHENIGAGEIGTEGFRPLVNDPVWSKVPGYLETPLDDQGYAKYEQDLRTLRSLLTDGPTPPATGRPARAARSRRASGPTPK
ncbi:MAG: deoxyribonuclease IV [Thermoplasmata archaeon]